MVSGLLEDLNVLDLSSGISGPYCTKLFADSGADVVKLESDLGDPLRQWSASHRSLDNSDGVLFTYLNAGKRSAPRDALAELLVGADLLVDDGSLTRDEIVNLRTAYPKLSFVSITPFGLTGPWRDRPATEFTLQAICGSLGARGEQEREPLQAGGRLGEFVSGAYAAVAGGAAALEARIHGRGEHVDVSVLECMCITLGGFGALQISLGRPVVLPSRFLELPSIEMASDGYIGFCTVTRQQFYDFSALIGHPEFIEDEELATFLGRTRRRVEFREKVQGWTSRHGKDEIVELATLLRIPVSLIGSPETVTTFDHFVERSVFVPGPDGRFMQPRRPYLIDGVASGSMRTAALDDRHTTPNQWLNSRRASNSEKPATSFSLKDIRIIDFTAFWAGPSSTQLLGGLGADVIKVESTQRPDGMRFSSSRPSSEPSWWEYAAHFQNSNANKRDVTLNLGSERGRELVLELIAKADVVMENFSPRVLDNFGITWDVIHEMAPHVVMVRMPAFGLTGPWRERTGFAQTMEQVSGLAWMTGYRGGFPIIPKGICDPNAGVHAAFALLAALAERARTGLGHFVECPMVEAALNIGAEIVLEYSAYGTALEREGNRGPVAAPQGLYACRGQEQWLALAVATDAQWQSLRQLLGDPAWARDVTLAEDSGRRTQHDMIDERLSEWAADQDIDLVVETFIEAGIPAAKMVEPQDVFDNPQLVDRGFAELVDHPIIGKHKIMGMPFRFSSREVGWVERPAPTLGQHNDEVLRGILGLSDDEMTCLRESNVIGDRPLGA